MLKRKPEKRVRIIPTPTDAQCYICPMHYKVIIKKLYSGEIKKIVMAWADGYWFKSNQDLDFVERAIKRQAGAR